jgi:hypothetical protein
MRVHEVVQPVFLEEEFLGGSALTLAAPGDRAHVAVSAKTSPRGMFEQDQADGRIAA